MRLEIMEITPALASEWLERNEQNRRVHEKFVAQYARDMIEGNWRLTGEPVTFARSGRLLNGQHRLRACVRAGRPFTSAVAFDADDDAQQAMDGGKQRTYGDRLTMRGVRSAHALAAAVRLVACYALGDLSKTFTAAEMDTVLDLHDDIPHSVTRSRAPHIANMGTVIAAMHYMTRYVAGLEQAERMLSVLESGVPSYPQCPVHCLRETILRKRGTPHQLTGREVQMLVAPALNAFFQKRPVKLLRTPTRVVIDGWTAGDLGLRLPRGQKSEAQP